MATRKKGGERAAMDQLEAEDVTSFGEDPELLDAAEQAALASGNADERQVSPAPSVAENRAENPAQHEPAADSEDEGGDEPETLSDEQVHKMGPNDSVPAWSLVKERQENRALKRNLDEVTRKLAEHEERWNRASSNPSPLPSATSF